MVFVCCCGSTGLGLGLGAGLALGLGTGNGLLTPISAPSLALITPLSPILEASSSSIDVGTDVGITLVTPFGPWLGSVIEDEASACALGRGAGPGSPETHTRAGARAGIGSGKSNALGFPNPDTPPFLDSNPGLGSGSDKVSFVNEGIGVIIGRRGSRFSGGRRGCCESS